MTLTTPIPGHPFDPERHRTDSRTPLDLEENETPGYLPKQYWITKTEGNKEAYDQLPISFLRADVKPMKNLTKAVDLVETFREQIADHMDWKIQCFSSQLLLSFGSEFVFSQDGAYYQAGIQKNRAGLTKNQTINKPVEAHVATLPSLLAVSSKAYEMAIIEGAQASLSVFGDGSYLGRVLAAAVSILPRCVNDADSHFEFKKKVRNPFKETFRDGCITLLNFTSQRKLGVKAGIQRFLNSSVTYITAAHNASREPYMKRIFAIYKEVAESYLRIFEQEDLFRKLTFTVRQEKIEWNEISHSMRTQMAQEVSLSVEVDKLKEMIGKREAKIVLLSLTGSDQSLHYERVIKKLSTTAWKYLETCLKNSKLRKECLDYLLRKSVNQLKADWPSSEIVVEAVGKNTLSKDEILQHVLLSLSREVFALPEHGKTIRHFLLVNDAWAEQQMMGRYALRTRVHEAKHNLQVKQLVKRIIQLVN